MPVRVKEHPNNLTTLHEVLLDNYVNAWVERTFQIIPPHTMDTNLVPWKCFGCSTPMHIRFDSNNHKDFCCPNCKHFSIGSKPNAIMLRFIWSFNIMVQNRLIKNSMNLEQLLKLKENKKPEV